MRAGELLPISRSGAEAEFVTERRLFSVKAHVRKRVIFELRMPTKDPDL